MDETLFNGVPILGILRGVKEPIIAPLTKTIISAGLTTVEITMNTPDAPKLIKTMIRAANGKLTVGAGTVLTLDDLTAALDAGARFIVMPTLEREVVAECVRQKIPVFPGALSPQEIYAAWQAGATMVKVFPIKFFGPDYLAEIKGPFADIKLLACGGISPDNIGTYFAKGANAIAFGAGIFRPEWLCPENLDHIHRSIRELLSAYQKHLPRR